MRIFDTAHNVWVTMSDEDAEFNLKSNSTYQKTDKPADEPKPAAKRAAAKASSDSKGA